MRMSLSFTRSYPDRPRPLALLRATEDSVGLDLAVDEPVVFTETRRFFRATTGYKLAAPLPEEHALLLLPRSGLYSKYNCIIPNAPGLIDPLYGGDLSIQLLHIPLPGIPEVVIPHGTRVAQLVLVKTTAFEPVYSGVQSPHMTRGGFGHTG